MMAPEPNLSTHTHVPPELYKLAWKSHQSRFVEFFQELRYNQELFDVTLNSENQNIQCHKTVLAANSSYFRDTFKANNSQHPTIIFKGVSFQNIEDIVAFMYNGEITMSRDRLEEFLSVGQYLEVYGLMEKRTLPNNPSTPKHDMDMVHLDCNGVGHAQDDTRDTDSNHRYGSIQNLDRNFSISSSNGFNDRQLLNSNNNTAHCSSYFATNDIPMVEVETEDEDDDEICAIFDNSTSTNSDDGMANGENLEQDNYAHSQSLEQPYQRPLSAPPPQDFRREFTKAEQDLRRLTGPRSAKISVESPSSKLKPPNWRRGDGGPHQCPECTRSFLYPSSLAEHLKSHSKQTVCKLCRKRISTVQNLKVHYVKVHFQTPESADMFIKKAKEKKEKPKKHKKKSKHGD